MARAAVKRGLRLSVGSWNTIWMRLRIGSLANCLAGISPMSSPSNMMLPSVLSISRMTMVEVVDLPQPELADQADAFAAMDREADAVHGAEHLRLRRRAAAHQLAHHAANAFDTLARIFLHQLFDHQQRLAVGHIELGDRGRRRRRILLGQADRASVTPGRGVARISFRV